MQSSAKSDTVWLLDNKIKHRCWDHLVLSFHHSLSVTSLNLNFFPTPNHLPHKGILSTKRGSINEEAQYEIFNNKFSSVAQSCLTLCDPMNRSMPGLPVHHQLPEFTQTHVHWVGDAIQPSHPLSSPSPPALNLSQNQGLFQWLNSLHEVAKVLEFQLQHQSFQWTPRLISFRVDWLDLLAVQGTLKSLL